MAKRGRPPKSLSELWRCGTFRWDRHRHLIKRTRLDTEQQAQAVELGMAGVPLYAVAGFLETTMGAVMKAMRGAGHPVTVPRGAPAAPRPRSRNGPGWKGDEASVVAKHLWLNRHYPRTGVCEECRLHVGTDFPNGTQYAFLKHPEPHTRDRADYRELCRSCHTTFDQLTRRERKR